MMTFNQGPWDDHFGHLLHMPGHIHIRYFLFPTLAFIPILLVVLVDKLKFVICVLHNRRGWFFCSELGGGRML